MSLIDEFMHNVLMDLKIKLDDEFDRNFERKAFFDKPWPASKFPNHKGSMMNRTGTLRRGMRSEIRNDAIHYINTEAYAGIQNEGGKITVTAKMKRYFWARYYETTGAVTKTKSGGTSASRQNVRLSQEAIWWKNMALMKVGSKITIPPRRFIGAHPKVDAFVKDVIEDNAKELELKITEILKQ